MTTLPFHVDNDPPPERPGFCVETPSELFLCAPSDATGGEVRGRYGDGTLRTWHYGLCGPRGKVMVFAWETDARIAADRVHGKVTTVPRRLGGHDVFTWETKQGATR